MKTKELNKILEGKTPQEQVEILKSELAETRNQHGIEKTNRKWWTATSVVMFVISLIILLLCKCEGNKMSERISGLEKANQELLVENARLECEKEYMKKEIDLMEDVIELQKRLLEKCESKKPVAVKKTSKPSQPSKVTEKMIETKTSDTKASEKIVIEEDCQEYIEAYTKPLQDSLNQIKNDSVEVIMTKENPDNSWEILRAKKAYADMLNMPVNPVIQGSHTFIEYWENPYRRKSEKSFRNGVILGVAGAGVYGVTEAMGHAIFYDAPADNSAAERKSATIKGLRIGAGVLGAASLVEFGRAWHFHKLEGEYIVSPTSIGVSINISP
jgi:hypothetical protein